MRTLVAGPWVGEFGWELFAWHGYIRALAKKFDKTVIIARSNSKALYDDFADEFVSFEPTGGISDAFFMHNVDVRTCLKKVVDTNNIKLNKGTTLLLPRRIGIPPHTHYTQHEIFGDHMIKPEYICFGEKGEKLFDFVFHIRSRDLRKEDNWSFGKWQTLKELLGDKKIACIGTKSESESIDGTDDLRGLELSRLMSILRNSTCAFGPSSGPMHLASLCALPHVVWSTPANKIRYEENWNPLQTRVLFNSDYSWHPSPEFVYKKYLEWNDNDEIKK